MKDEHTVNDYKTRIRARNLQKSDVKYISIEWSPERKNQDRQENSEFRKST